MQTQFLDSSLTEVTLVSEEAHQATLLKAWKPADGPLAHFKVCNVVLPSSVLLPPCRATGVAVLMQQAGCFPRTQSLQHTFYWCCSTSLLVFGSDLLTNTSHFKFQLVSPGEKDNIPNQAVFPQLKFPNKLTMANKHTCLSH